MEFRSLKILGIMAFATFCFVWAWLSIDKKDMYIPPGAIVSGLTALIGGRLVQTYAEKSKIGKE